MKKFLPLILVFCMVVTACSWGWPGSPKMKVEEYLASYQKLDNKVIDDLNNDMTGLNLTTDEQQSYIDIMKENYRKLSYVLSNEKISGNTASVDVKLKVIDLSGIENSAQTYIDTNPKDFHDVNGNIIVNKYFNYKISLMKKAMDTKTYNTTFTLTKNNNNWSVNKLTDEQMQMIKGIY